MAATPKLVVTPLPPVAGQTLNVAATGLGARIVTFTYWDDR